MALLLPVRALVVLAARVKTYLKTRAELNHFLGLDVLKAVDTGDTITNGQHAASLLELRLAGLVEDAVLKDAGHLRGGCKEKGKRGEGKDGGGGGIE